MREYLALLSDVLENGRPRTDRTGTGTISVFRTTGALFAVPALSAADHKKSALAGGGA